MVCVADAVPSTEKTACSTDVISTTKTCADFQILLNFECTGLFLSCSVKFSYLSKIKKPQLEQEAFDIALEMNYKNVQDLFWCDIKNWHPHLKYSKGTVTAKHCPGAVVIFLLTHGNILK